MAFWGGFGGVGGGWGVKRAKIPPIFDKMGIIRAKRGFLYTREAFFSRIFGVFWDYSLLARQKTAFF